MNMHIKFHVPSFNFFLSLSQRPS